ncbi:outer membrane autotransporter protein [Variovorax boronicumulans]|uniref:autotransporter outer membrane beta-barrel domain-containing protein n=1 Tax=Variovorax boronicumulans TaxID=436515 RepID=UPI0027855C9E|nr:autotransporter outer membrane beta-barrel domain-containing protein [Variovorax boronicumulans]MDQ0012214.1 outer membrane autotransporter protein [Variovorax boronicumulans]
MNTAYKTVWNAAIGAWVAVSETTRARGKRSTSRRAGRAAGLVGLTKVGMLAVPAFFATSFLPAQAFCTTAGSDVTCNGAANPLAPSFANGASNLNVTVNPGATVGVLLGVGGNAMTLTGSDVKLTNGGRIDPQLLGTGNTSLSSGVVMGNANSSTATVINNGMIGGTRLFSVGLTGLALAVQNSVLTSITNTGTMTTGPVVGSNMSAADAAVVAAYGGAQVNMVNTATGTITGRIAFESATSGGHTFTNAGTINGSVSLGSGERSDTFIAVTGSSITGGSAPASLVALPSGGSLNFAAGGTVDAGMGGTDTLVLRNIVSGPGSGNAGTGTIKAAQYLNFENLQVDSGTWTLNGAVVSGSALLNGGVAIFDDAGAFGTGTLTGSGGAMQAAVNGLTLGQNVNLTSGLIVQGGNSFTLGGTVSGGGGLIKNGAGTLTLTGINNFSGGFALNDGGVTLGNASALGSGLFLVSGNVDLNTTFTGTLNNLVQLNGALTLDGTGTLTFGAPISGGGSLTVNGSNLALAASNTYGGGTTMGGGRLDVGSNTALGTGDLTINGASVLTGAAGVVLANNVVLNNTLNFGAGGSGGALTLNGAISGTGGISLAGAPGLTLNGASTFTGGFNLGAGALTVGNDKAMGQAGVTVSGPSSIESNKSVSLANDFRLNARLTAGGSNDLALNGSLTGLGLLRKTGTGRLTLGGASTFSGGVDLQGGALRVGTNTSLGLGALTVNGNAALDASADVNLANEVVLNAGLDIGGANDIALGGSISGTGPLSYSGSGTLTLANANFWTGGTTLKSGTLNVGDNFALGQGALAVTGNANLRANVPGTVLGNALTLGAGTTLNVDGSNPLALIGTIDGGGALALSGPGAVVLAGANTYSGGTTVSGTTLGVVNPTGSATGSGAVQVQAGGALVGNGSIAGTVSVGSGLLEPGLGGAGTLTVGGLNLTAGSVLDYDLGQAGTAGGLLNDLVRVNGNLQLDGTLNVAQSKGGVFGAGVYRLIDYTGTLTDNGLDIGSAPVASKDLQVQTSVAQQVNLVNRAGLALNFWDGGDAGNYNDGKIAGGSGTWRVGVPGDGWTGADGKVNAAWAQDQFAVFGGTGGTVKVSNAGGTVRITGAQFAADGYVVQGDAIELGASGTVVRVGDGSGTDTTRSATLNVALIGTGGLVKDDVGTLVLGGTNTYTGGTTVKAGVLQGSTASLQGNIVNNAEVVFDQGPPIVGTYAGAMSGTGRLRKTGGGILLMGGPNSYTGGTFVDAGLLATNFTGALGSGPVSVAAPGRLLFGVTADAGSAAIDNRGSVTFQEKASAGTATITNAAGGVLAFSDNASADKATVINQAGAQVRIDQTVTGASFGSLNGAGEVVLGAKALTLGGSGGDNTLSGAIGGAGGSVVKVGGGTLTLSGASTYTGGTTVAAGTLSVNNKSGSATGTGAVQVQSGATLAGSGSIAGAVTIAKGGILAAGNSPGTLTLGALALAGGSTLNYELGQAGVPGGALNDLINVTGDLQLDGTLNIAQSAGGTFGPGLYRLMSYGGTLTDFGLDIGTAPVGTKLADLQVQTSVAQQVNLVNRAGLALNFWDGGDSTKYNDGQVAGGSGTWRVGSPGDGWTDMDGKLNANWAQSQFAVFSGKGGTVTVDGGGGAVRIAGAQFAVDGYTVQGDGITLDNANSVVRVGDGTAAGANMTATMNVALSGAGGISKEDAGRLILGGANTYTGGTTVKGGVLQGSATSLQGNIVNNAEVAFDQDKTAGTYAGAMSGTGKLRKIGAGTLTLASANSYSGGTLVDAGTLATDTSGALGSGAVSIASGAALQFGGKADAGKLAIANQGTLRLQDGANAASATVTNAAGAQVRIDLATTGASIGALGGAGDVVLGAKALTTGAIGSDSTLSGAITGAGGSLVKVGAGTLTLSGTASYSGETRVAAGTLKAGAANAFSAASSAVVASGATLDLAGFSQTVAGLSNSGTVALAGAVPGTTLTVHGNYVGNNGVLKLGTVLNGGAGPSDRLVIDGGTASGKTRVQIANLGGLGARTSGAGIEVVSARNGATTTAQTTKDAFVLAGGHVDAGAFEYRLHAGDASGGGENWYLRTEADPGTPGTPGGGPGLPAYRAEASLFAALPNQLRQSNLGMLASRSQRIGDDDVRGGAGSTSGTDGSYRRAWGRLISTDMDIRQGGTVSPHSEGRVTGLQAGTDLWANPDWRAGIYVGQLDGDTRVSGFGSGLPNTATGRNDLRSQYLGLYGTFTTEDGFYADAVLQAGRHRYTVQPLLGGGVEGKGNSFLASIEVGKAFAIGAGGWSVEPQLQLIHQRLRLDDVSIPGALVQQDADSGWIGRAGVRIKGSFATGAGTLQPYARLNVYRSAKGNDVARFVNPAAITPVGAPIGGTSTELAAGFTLAVSQRTSIYGELGKQWASGGDARVGSSINAAAGVRVKW